MGNWFTNVHIRKTPELTDAIIKKAVSSLMEEKGYRQTDNPDTADTTVTFYFPENSPWITIYSDGLAHDDPESSAAILSPLSAQLHTDALAIACFDSDYLYLNLINADKQLDGWIGIGAGKEVGITRRSNLSVWKKKVSDYPDFSGKAKGKYVIADQFLLDAADNLGMSFEQSAFNGDTAGDSIVQIHYERTTADSEKPQMAHYLIGLPCFLNEKSTVNAVNLGAAGKGLSVYFLGSYVEREEITFSQVEIECLDYSVQAVLKKELLSDGRWAYAYHDPEFPIPEKVSKRIRKDKRASLEWAHRISITFIPSGNPRKMLDITVAFVPRENPEGSTQWNVCNQYGSKKAFIEHYNKITKRVRAFEPDPNQWLPYLKEEDFDE